MPPEGGIEHWRGCKAEVGRTLRSSVESTSRWFEPFRVPDVVTSNHHAKDFAFGCHGFGCDNMFAQHIADRPTIIMIGLHREPMIKSAKPISWVSVSNMGGLRSLGLKQAKCCPQT